MLGKKVVIKRSVLRFAEDAVKLVSCSFNQTVQQGVTNVDLHQTVLYPTVPNYFFFVDVFPIKYDNG